MSNTWKGEISRTILNIFRPYNGIDIFKLPFLEQLYEKNFVVPYILSRFATLSLAYFISLQTHWAHKLCRLDNI